MIKNTSGDGTVLTGNDRFVGLGKDLLDSIGSYLNIRYELRLVRDGKYGLPTDNGWVGMIGEVVRKVIDRIINHRIYDHL